jgi:NADH-quinone oxidoreductase subunit N
MVLSASLFSLAGIPPTAGFIGKFYLLVAGVGSALWLLVIVLVVTSAIGLFYYLRVIVALYSNPKPAPAESAEALPLLENIALAGLLVLLIWFGVYPATLMRFIQSAAL